MGLRYGSHRLTLEQRAAIEAANGWKTLTVAGFLNGAWESGRVKLLPTTQLKRFRYFYDQWVEERFLVWRRFLAFLERELELATPDERFSLCQSLRASHQSGHFLTDVYTLSGALSDPHLPAIRLIEAGNPNQEQHFFREFAINKVHIPGGCIRLDTASAKSADQPVPHMISRAESKPHPVGWVLQPHKWNDGQGIFLAELNVIRHRVEDPLVRRMSSGARVYVAVDGLTCVFSCAVAAVQLRQGIRRAAQILLNCRGNSRTVLLIVVVAVARAAHQTHRASFLLLAAHRLGEPVKALVETLPRCRARGLHVPRVRGDLLQLQSLHHIVARQRVWQILLVGKHENHGGRQLGRLEHLPKLVARLFEAVLIIGVHNEDHSLRVEEVMAPQTANLVLPINPESEHESDTNQAHESPLPGRRRPTR